MGENKLLEFISSEFSKDCLLSGSARLLSQNLNTSLSFALIVIKKSI